MSTQPLGQPHLLAARMAPLSHVEAILLIVREVDIRGADRDAREVDTAHLRSLETRSPLGASAFRLNPRVRSLPVHGDAISW